MKVSGIYKIENLINGKVYIGQSKDLFLRYSQHFSNGMKSQSKIYLYRSMNYYGIDNFSFQIIKITYDLDYWERFFIYWYQSYKSEFGYNLTDGGQKGNRRKDDFKYTDEMKRKMSESAKRRWKNPIYRENILESQSVGKKSDEGRRNRSEATRLMWKNGKFANRENNPNMQRKGRKMPESMRLKMKLVSKLRERKHHEDYELYIIQGGELNYSEFCKHYTNGKNLLLED